MTVGDVVRTLLLDTPVHFDGMPTRDAVLQVTLDGETFYAIDMFIDYGDGGVVAQLMPWPPDSVDDATREADFAARMQATQDDSLLERWPMVTKVVTLEGPRGIGLKGWES